MPLAGTIYFDYRRTMKDGPNIALIGSLVGDPARANMLEALMSGRVLTLALLSLFLCSFASAGGPRLVGGPAVGTRAAFGIESAMREGHIMFAVADGEKFVPKLFAELGVPIRSVSVARPSLDDVFLAHTGTTIRDKEAQAENPMARFVRRR